LILLQVPSGQTRSGSADGPRSPCGCRAQRTGHVRYRSTADRTTGLSSNVLSRFVTFDGDFGDASLEGLSVEHGSFCENNSLCSVHQVVSRHVPSDRDRWNLFGINGESRRISHAQQSAKFVA
jgi:hypothetical protein